MTLSVPRFIGQVQLKKGTLRKKCTRECEAHKQGLVFSAENKLSFEAMKIVLRPPADFKPKKMERRKRSLQKKEEGTATQSFR